MKIAIMTDVNAGLDYIGYDSGITCLRSSVNFPNEVLVDGIDIRADEFYDRNALPLTQLGLCTKAGLNQSLPLSGKVLSEREADE